VRRSGTAINSTDEDVFNHEVNILSCPYDPADIRISGSRSLDGPGLLNGAAWSSLAATLIKSAESDTECDFTFSDGPPDIEALGFRLSDAPVLLEKRTWASLATVILLHITLAFLLWISPETPAADPKCIEVKLVTMLEGPGLSHGGVETGRDEQPCALAPPAAAPQPALQAKNEPPDPKPHPDKIARVAPQPKQHKEIKTLQQPLQTESHPNESQSSDRPVGTDAGSTPEAGTGNGNASSGQSGAGGPNGSRGSGASEIAFGSPDGPSFLHKVLPAYPALAKRLEKEGTVLLRVTIDEHGRPVEVEVLNKAGFGFDEEAVKAVKGSTFAPARMAGKPLACRALLPIRFVLRSS
jgi:protein TonB